MWDDIIEIIIEILLEGTLEVLPNKKIPSWIRVLAWLVFVIIVIGLISLGLYLLKTLVWLGVIFIILGVALAIYLSVKMKYRDIDKE